MTASTWRFLLSPFSIVLLELSIISVLSAVDKLIEAINGDETPQGSFMSLERLVQTTKDAIQNGEDIKLQDLLREEVGAANSRFKTVDFVNEANDLPDIADKLKLYWRATERVLHMLCILGWYGNSTHGAMIQEAIDSLAEPPPEHQRPGVTYRLFPIWFAIYVSGIAAVGRNNFELLDDVFKKPQMLEMNTRNARYKNALVFLCDYLILGFFYRGNRIPENANESVKEHFLSEELEDMMSRFVGRGQTFRHFLHLFEVILALYYLDASPTLEEFDTFRWFPPNATLANSNSNSFIIKFWQDSGGQKLLQAGCCDGDVDRLRDQVNHYQRVLVDHLRWDAPNYLSAFEQGLTT